MSRFYEPDDFFDDDYEDFLDEPEEEGWLDYDKTITYSDEYLLYTAVINKNIAEIQALISKGVDVNVKFENGWSALMLAAFYGDLDLTKELINSGANVNFCGEKYTILMAACSCNDPTVQSSVLVEVVQLLIEKGANVNAMNSKRMDALMCAAYSGHIQIVKLLLPLSNKNNKDYIGWTALFWAISNQQVEITQLLLDEGFSLNVKDVRNNTPYELAQTQDNEDLLALFPTADKNLIYVYQDCSKTIEEMFNVLNGNERPKFFSDVCNVLVGVNSESIVKILADKDYDFSQFLTLNEDKLIDLGVSMPFQRHRILGGLHRLHKHPYKSVSIPNLFQKKANSTFDVSCAILSCVKQIILMEAAVKYILPHLSYNISKMNKKDVQYFQNRIVILRKKIVGLKSALMFLKGLVLKWDQSRAPPDLITQDSIKRRHRGFPCKCITFAVFSLALTIYVKFR